MVNLNILINPYFIKFTIPRIYASCFKWNWYSCMSG